MIVDTSAIVALVMKEPGHERLFEKLSQSRATGIGTPTLSETGIVLRARLGFDPTALILRLLHEFTIETIPFGEAHWREADEAYEQFGKGFHPASLNFGDCLSYAVAKLAGQPLLCVGGDFPLTDLEIV